jgi:cyclic-di-GMP-binding protein
MPSFDVVSELDWHEVSNAVDQANREVVTRFDFKGTDSKYVFKDETVTMQAEVDFQLQQMLDILRAKLAKRNIDMGHLKTDDPELLHKKATQVVRFQHGIAADVAKKIIKALKEEKIKVQAQIQGDQVRVTGKKRDILQEAIAFMRDRQEEWAPLQFNNFRD